MHGLVRLTFVALLLSPGVAWAQTSASEQILNRHVAAMKKGDLEGVMADYANDAVVIAPHGIAPSQKAALANDVFPAKENIRKLFSVLTDKDHVPANRTMETRYESRGNDVTVMYWLQNKGTAQQASGADIFGFRNGKIAFQDVTVDAAKH